MPRSTPAAISVLACDDDRSRAALVGVFDRGNVEFLHRHLDELTGDVVLECEHLEGLDSVSAAALLEVRATRGTAGAQILFRGIRPSCRQTMLECAVGPTGGNADGTLSGSSAPREPRPAEDRASQPSDRSPRPTA